MPYKATVYRLMIASPSDVTNERSIIPEIINNWNIVHSLTTEAVLLPVKWETHSTPSMGDRPQSIINKQLVEQSDALVGIFWTRLGTPTGEAESGSVEEVQKFIAAGKPVLLYFSNAPVMPESVDLEQYKKLKEFKEVCFKEGLVDTYDSVEQLREKLNRHLVNVARDLQGRSEEEIGFVWTDNHDEALALYKMPHRTFEIFSLVAESPKSIEEILDAVPGDKYWIKSIADDLCDVDFIRPSVDHSVYKLTERGKKINEALDQLPQTIKDQAHHEVWGFDGNSA